MRSLTQPLPSGVRVVDTGIRARGQQRVAAGRPLGLAREQHAVTVAPHTHGTDVHVTGVVVSIPEELETGFFAAAMARLLARFSSGAPHVIVDERVVAMRHDVAPLRAIVFVAGDQASFMTGSELVIDGGYTAK